MRGAISIGSVVLFMAFAAAVAFLAFLVDTYAQMALGGDAALAASSVADFVASQIRDTVAIGSIPGVVSFKKVILTPREFYGFDSAVASICVKNIGGNILVNVTLAATRGRGNVLVNASTWVYNITGWAAASGKRLYLTGQFYRCPGWDLPPRCVVGQMLNLTMDGCGALLTNASLYVGYPP